MRRKITIVGIALIAAIGSLGTLSADEFYISYSDFNNNNVHKFSASGTDLGVFASAGLSVPRGLAFDSLGNLYVANESNNTVRRFDRSGADLGVFAAAGLRTPVSIAFDSQGNLYVSNALPGIIRKFGPSGTSLGIFAIIDSSALLGIAFDRNGNLYAANASDNTIHEFGPTGVDLGIFADTGLAQPWGLAFDSGGNLYVANSAIGGGFGNPLGSSIRKFSPTGVDLGTFASRSGLVGPLNPHDLAFDSSGNLYVADNEGHQICIFGPNGDDLANIFVAGSPSSIAFAPVPEPTCLQLFASGLLVFVSLGYSARWRYSLDRSAFERRH